MSMGNVTGSQHAQLRPGSVWNPSVAIAGAFGAIPGAIAAAGSLMGGGGLMSGLSQGPGFSQMMFTQASREMVAGMELKESNLKSTLSRIHPSLAESAGAISQGLQMLNQVDPAMGRTVDSFMSLVAGNTHLSSAGLDASDQYARLAGDRPGDSGYRGRALDLASKLENHEFGANADARAMTHALAARTGGKADQMLAGSIRELMNGLGVSYGDIDDMVVRNKWNNADVEQFAASTRALSQLPTMTNGRLSAATQYVHQSTGMTGTGFAELSSSGGSAMRAMGLTGAADEAAYGGIAMRATADTAGSVQYQTVAAMATVDADQARRVGQMLRSGDTVGANRLIDSFRTGSQSSLIGRTGDRSLTAVMGKDMNALTSGLAEMNLERDMGLSNPELLRRLQGVGDLDLKDIAEGGGTNNVFGRLKIQGNDIDLAQQYAVARLASQHTELGKTEEQSTKLANDNLAKNGASEQLKSALVGATDGALRDLLANRDSTAVGGVRLEDADLEIAQQFARTKTAGRHTLSGEEGVAQMAEIADVGLAAKGGLSEEPLTIALRTAKVDELRSMLKDEDSIVIGGEKLSARDQDIARQYARTKLAGYDEVGGAAGDEAAAKRDIAKSGESSKDLLERIPEIMEAVGKVHDIAGLFNLLKQALNLFLTAGQKKAEPTPPPEKRAPDVTSSG